MADFAYCPHCGKPTVEAERGGRLRSMCPGCGWVGWKNPKAAVAVILRDDRGRVLLVRRLSPPQGWCIPCGNIEWDEDIRTAGIRELEEETGLRVELGPVFAVHSNFHDPRAHSVGVWFLGRVTGGTERPGGDAGEIGWFDPGSPPSPLAFPTDVRVLRDLESAQDGPRA